MLVHILEKANSHPNKALDYLKSLFYDADRISQYSDNVLTNFEEIFARDQNESQTQQKIDSFM
jgi:hypothetical protein